MKQYTQGRFSQHINLLRRQFAQSNDLLFGDVLSPELLQQAIDNAKLKIIDTVYTPLMTVLLFLWQVCSQDQSCRAVVAKLVAFRAALGLSACSASTGAYCQARQRIPEGFFAHLVRGTAKILQQQIPPEWLWKNREVKLFDGSTVSMPDTPKNQQAYPQQTQQASGVGFPIARIAAVFSLATATVLDLGICRYQGKGQSELGLLRLLRKVFQAGDVMLADRYLCSWHELALLQQQGVDFVARLHQSRKVDFRKGKRLGPNDHIVCWDKPRCPEWMDQVTWESLPDQLVVREIRVRLETPGFRTTELVVATSLLDAEEFSHDDLAELYRARWNVELDLRSLKESMRMDVLRCKTPEMVRAEIWAHLLAYNLVRTIMAQSAQSAGLHPRSISFKGAVQTLLAFQPHLESNDLATYEMSEKILKAISEHIVGDRPDRYEPRKRKRRPKSYPLLMEPRSKARKDLGEVK